MNNEKSNVKREKKMGKIEKIYGLSPMQEGMLFHSIMEKEEEYYYQQMSFIVEGEFNAYLFEKSLNIVIERYDVLRTNFVYYKVKKPQQVVFSEKPIKAYFKDLSSNSEDVKEKLVNDYLDDEKITGFDLVRGQLIKLSIFKLKDYIHKIIISNHHIILDGWSMGIVTKEVLQIYNMLLKGEHIKLAEAQSYSTFINWIKKANNDEDMKYWKDYLTGYDQIVGIPSYIGATSSQIYKNEDEFFTLNKDITNKLKVLARQNKVTLNIIIQSMIGILLQKYNNTNDVVIGSVVSGRNPEIKNIENAVGLFINIIPVRIRCNNKKTFVQILGELQKQLTECKRHEHCALVDIQTAVNMKHGIFNSIIEFENYPISEALTNSEDNEKFRISDVQLYMKSNYNFNISVFPGNEIEFAIRFNADAYDREFVKGIKYQLCKLANEVISNPNIAVGDIDILTEEEKKKIVLEFNATKTNYPREKTLQQLFEEQVEKTPDNIAVVYKNKKLTYVELNRRANRIAEFLMKKGAKGGTIVSVILKRSEKMIITILGILKAGAAYLPIDPKYPRERILEILNDSTSEILLTDSNTLDKEIVSDIKKAVDTIFIDDIEENIDKCCNGNPKNVGSSDDIACIIYTSGSTGKPKGNLMTHYNMSRVVKDTNYIKIDENQVLLQLSNYAFDGSVFDIYGALLNGARLVMVDSEILMDIPQLCSLIEREKVTMFFVTTALFNALVDVNIGCFKNVKKVLFGGERVSVNHVKKAFEFMGPGRLIHVYGPTEGTVFTTYYRVDKIDDSLGTIPIGKPIANTEVYVLDCNNKIQPIGVMGELCISGSGVVKGYLNRPELTAEKFIPNPYAQGKKIYRTGDIVRWLPNGEIEFVDRKDSQVKLRGFRIELGEIETQLLKHEKIKKAVVLCNEEKEGSKYLQGYIVADEVLTVAELRKHLEKTLPEYMIPAYFSQLEAMPLTSNGKIDKKALIDVERIDSSVEYVEARNDIEKTLVSVWKDILGEKEIGIDDNYFSHGGDSIKAIQIASRLEREELHMNIKDLFQHPTIRELGKYIENKSEKINQEIIKGEVKLTPIQNWFFREAFTNMSHFNQSVMLYNKDGFNEKVVEDIIKKIMQHHDALRMVYKKSSEGIIQYNKGFEEENISISVIDLRGETEYIEKIETAANNIQGSINLNEGPLLKACIFKTSNGDHLLIVIHHLVVDGVSWRIILEDFAVGYTQKMKGEEISFQDKSTSFKEWSEKLYDFAASNSLIKEIDYWDSILGKAVKPLPKDMECDKYVMKDTESVSIQFLEEDTEKLLKDVNKAYNTQINDILIAALGLAINEWCGNEEILINMEGHGRENIIENVNINRTVGWFTTIYPISININKSNGISYYIKSVKDKLNRIPNNGIGYGIIKYLNDKCGNNKFKENKNAEISFNYLGQFDEDIDNDVFEISSYSTGKNVGDNVEKKNVLDINGFTKDKKLVLTIDYSKNQYLKETIENLAEKYKNSIIKVINHCVSKEKTELTPTDFSYKELSIEDLDDIVNCLDDDINN